MKYVISICTVLLLIFFITGCSREKAPVKAKFNTKAVNKMEGVWELRATTAAMMPGVLQHPPGNGNLLKFLPGNKYERYQNRTFTESGNYVAVKDNSVEENVCLDIQDGQYEDRIIYNNQDVNPKIFFHFKSDERLLFISGCYAIDGGHTEEYERIDQ
ncbi:MAG: hypothetical protein QM791_10995 [Ferruginibacter sp.]